MPWMHPQIKSLEDITYKHYIKSYFVHVYKGLPFQRKDQKV